MPDATVLASAQGTLTMNTDLATLFGRALPAARRHRQPSGPRWRSSRWPAGTNLHPMIDTFEPPPFHLEVRVGGRRCRCTGPVPHEPLRAAQSGQPFTLRFENRSGEDVAVALLVDGSTPSSRNAQAPTAH